MRAIKETFLARIEMKYFSSLCALAPFLNDVETVTPRIAIGALLLVLGTVAISLAKV